MANKSKRRRQQQAAKAAGREPVEAHRRRELVNPGTNSRCARKVRYCAANGVDALDVPEPKPWR